MKLALIPPYSKMNLIKMSDYQLILPQCLSELRYAKAYQKVRADGSYLIMDNGVAEGLTYTPQALHDLGRSAMVNEIVIPDVMLDAAATWNLCKAFQDFKTPEFNYMGVVQGTMIDECTWMIDQYAKKDWITTLGIPRHLLTTTGQNKFRVMLAEYISDFYPGRFEVHLLGTNPTFIEEIWQYRNQFKHLGVRGVDTSAPFNYAYASAAVGQGSVVDRPADYFNIADELFDQAFLDLNIGRFIRWSDGKRD